MMNIEQFVMGVKTKIIAPAGYGKTHFIADCVKFANDRNLGKQLILTHTHAGIASIRAKLLKCGIPSSAYNIETICGYAQKYVLGFATASVPEQNTSGYYKNIIPKVAELFSKQPIRNIIKKTYSGIFIDEYQDCTANQHNMLMQLKDAIPMHLLGDPMQGIFNFGEPLVDFDSELNDFSDASGSLEQPWRWELNGNNPILGQSLKTLRKYLEQGNDVDLSQNWPAINIIHVTGTVYNDLNYRRQVLRLSRIPNTLIIANSMLRQRQLLRNNLALSHFQLLEAIDDPDFYNLAIRLDTLLTSTSQFSLFKETCEQFLFNKTDIDTWFNNNGLKKKTKIEEKEKANQLKQHVDNLLDDKISKTSLFYIIKLMRDVLKLKYQRPELLNTIIKVLQNAIVSNCSICNAMYDYKNHIRRTGRNLHKQCIGSTLLTKGLEFDNVIILDAHLLDKKNFYVAATRACKTLTIFTNSLLLTFNN